MKRKIIINFKQQYDMEKNRIIFVFNSKTKVKELLLYLINFAKDSEDINIDSNLIGHFSFININGEKQKAQLEFSLKKFLKNFKYNLKEIDMYYDICFGIGAYCELEDIAKIQINANEPRHNNPHVHICRINKHDNYYRIDLNTFLQMKGDKIDWSKEFSRKERKAILKFLNDNKEKLIDYYERCRKGEYIIEEYILASNGRKYFLNTNRTY